MLSLKRHSCWVAILGLCASSALLEAGAIAGPQGSTFSSAHSSRYKHCPRDGRSVNFPAYFLGARFEGLERTARTRRCDRPRRDEPIRANYVDYVYGSCDPAQHGCQPPLQVQSWPACERNPSSYDGPLIGPDRSARFHIRGVPAHFYDDGTRLELSTGKATIVLFGDRRGQLKRAAEALRSIPGQRFRIGPRKRLPRPGRKALSGKLRCDR